MCAIRSSVAVCFWLLALICLTLAGTKANAVESLIQEKADTPKSSVKGTLTLGNKTYKLAHALAYPTKDLFGDKVTRVFLSENSLDAAELVKVIKRDGHDFGFSPFVPQVRLGFDEKGSISDVHLFADNKTVSGGSCDNNVTIKDGRVKGTAKREKREEMFEVEFDLPLLKLDGPGAKPSGGEEKKDTPKTKGVPREEGKKDSSEERKGGRSEGKLAPAKEETFEKLETAIPEAIRLLEAKEYATFAKNFLPPEAIKLFTANRSLADYSEEFGKRFGPQILDALKVVNLEKPLVDPSGKKVVFELKEEIDGKETVTWEKIDKRWYLKNWEFRTRRG